MVSTGPEPSSAFSAINLGIVLPSVTLRWPLDEAKEEDQDQEEDDELQLWIMGHLLTPPPPRNL